MRRPKSYPNYLKNLAKRRSNPNIRQIKSGTPTSYWMSPELYAKNLAALKVGG